MAAIAVVVARMLRIYLMNQCSTRAWICLQDSGVHKLRELEMSWCGEERRCRNGESLDNGAWCLEFYGQLAVDACSAGSLLFASRRLITRKCGSPCRCL